MKVSKTTLYLLCILTLIGFPFLAYIILLFFGDNYFFEDIFLHNAPLSKQLFRGFLYGCTSGLLGLWLVQNEYLKPVSSMFSELLGDININWADIIFFSLCAGIGEEIFFRGALQYFAGIWPTAVFFIFIHGYLSLTKWRITVYGVFMVVIVAGMGYINDYFGIWAAVTAHFVYDVFMFAYLIKFQKSLPNAE